EGLAASAPWLAAAWEKRWAQSQSSSFPASPRSLGVGAADAAPEVPAADPTEIERALTAIRGDPDTRGTFEEGARHPNGGVDRSMTEFRVAGWLKRRGFREDVAWAVVRACGHTKSPRDPRGRRRFVAQVWGRLAAGPEV
ncbi:MAG: hypothetical protein KGJ23_16190, partial [Euryarchaeota archaeon]|nr:hypothetical protein [Euryarchaeota archaeon]